MTRQIPRAWRRSVADWIGFLFYGGIAAHLLWVSRPMSLLLLPTFAHEALIALSFLMRGPASVRARGWTARAVAYVGALGLVVFIAGARAVAPEWLTPTASLEARAAGLILWFAGSVFGLWAVWHLRRSFSLEAEARALVTSGPYRFARHPIYTGYLLQYAGMWAIYPTLPFALALVAWFLVLRVRVSYEEAVLQSAFADYGGYMQSVGRFMPRSVVVRRAPVAGGTS